MSKKADLDWAYSLSPMTMERLAMAYELGRIAGIGEAVKMASKHLGEWKWTSYDSLGYVLRAHARKLRAGLSG
jgi:hypothetical protein